MADENNITDHYANRMILGIITSNIRDILHYLPIQYYNVKLYLQIYRLVQ